MHQKKQIEAHNQKTHAKRICTHANAKPKAFDFTWTFCVRWIWILGLSIHSSPYTSSLIHYGNCHRTLIKVAEYFKDLVRIIKEDAPSSKQLEIINLKRIVVRMHVCNNFFYSMPNVTHASLMIAADTAEYGSRHAHDQFAIKLQVDEFFFARHFTSVIGSCWRRR